MHEWEMSTNTRDFHNGQTGVQILFDNDDVGDDSDNDDDD